MSTRTHTAQQKGFTGNECNRINVYKGWRFISSYTLPDDDTFVDHSWENTDTSQGGFTLADIWVKLKTARGGTLSFTIDGAQRNEYASTYP